MRWVLAAVAFMVSVSAFAELKYNKDWMWDSTGDDFSYAATITSSGRILGQYCYLDSDSCIYTVSLGITCQEEESYPVLINSDTGVIKADMICGHKISNSNYAFYIKPFDAIDLKVRSASNIGFAVAMESGKFKVVRFSLSGSTYAIESMREETKARVLRKKNRKESYTKDRSEQYL